MKQNVGTTFEDLRKQKIRPVQGRINSSAVPPWFPHNADTSVRYSGDGIPPFHRDSGALVTVGEAGALTHFSGVLRLLLRKDIRPGVQTRLTPSPGSLTVPSRSTRFHHSGLSTIFKGLQRTLLSAE